MVHSKGNFKMRFAIVTILFASLCFCADAVEQVVPAPNAAFLPPPVPTNTPSISLPKDTSSASNGKTLDGYTLDEEMIYRINFGRSDDVKLLLEKGANPNARSKQGDPVLSIAIDRNDKEAVGMAMALLDKGADPNQPDRSKNYPIVSATRNGQPEIVAALIDKGADFQAKSSSGTPILDLAKINGNPDLIKLIKDEIAKEDMYAADLRKPERYKQILHDYAYNNCVYQYWQFYFTSRQEPSQDEDVQRKLAKIKAAINNLVKKIQRYYPFTSTATLQNIATVAVQEIFNDLDAMISNSNRYEHGVGKDEDAEKRCQKIVGDIDFNVAVPPGFLAPPPANAPQ